MLSSHFQFFPRLRRKIEGAKHPTRLATERRVFKQMQSENSNPPESKRWHGLTSAEKPFTEIDVSWLYLLFIP